MVALKHNLKHIFVFLTSYVANFAQQHVHVARFIYFCLCSYGKNKNGKQKALAHIYVYQYLCCFSSTTWFIWSDYVMLSSSKCRWIPQQFWMGTFLGAFCRKPDTMTIKSLKS